MSADETVNLPRKLTFDSFRLAAVITPSAAVMEPDVVAPSAVMVIFQCRCRYRSVGTYDVELLDREAIVGQRSTARWASA
jgi:hypothetical protein